MWHLWKALETFLVFTHLSSCLSWQQAFHGHPNVCSPLPSAVPGGFWLWDQDRTSAGHQLWAKGFCVAALMCYLCFWAYLVLSVSKQVGRYLSNRMVRLALSVWTSLWSIQLLTAGFHPRSAGLMYRIPGRKENVVHWGFHTGQNILYPRELSSPLKIMYRRLDIKRTETWPWSERTHVFTVEDQSQSAPDRWGRAVLRRIPSQVKAREGRTLWLISKICPSVGECSGLNNGPLKDMTTS